MGSDKLIYFRTDGNRKIASGHLMRCVSIALACQDLGMGVCFLVSDRESYGLLQSILHECRLGMCNIEDSISVIQLTTAIYDNLEQELPEVISLLSSRSPFLSCPQNNNTNDQKRNIIYFLDSYYVTEKYLSSLKPFTKIAYMDDIQLFDYPVDLLINYDVIPDSSLPSYQAAYQKAGRLLLGAAYTPLRRQFQGKQIAIKEQVADVLVTTGGSDPYHFCLAMIHLICNDDQPSPWHKEHFPHTFFHIVMGKLNEDKELLRQLSEKYSFVQLHENVSDMASLMSKCDLAVSAAGTTLYELCALGIPTVSFTMADNQLTAAMAFDKAGAIPCAGDLRHEPDKVLAGVSTFLTNMSGCHATTRNASWLLRKSAHETMRRLVDEKGAFRIAGALRDIINH